MHAQRIPSLHCRRCDAAGRSPEVPCGVLRSAASTETACSSVGVSSKATTRTFRRIASPARRLDVRKVRAACLPALWRSVCRYVRACVPCLLPLVLDLSHSHPPPHAQERLIMLVEALTKASRPRRVPRLTERWCVWCLVVVRVLACLVHVFVHSYTHSLCLVGHQWIGKSTRTHTHTPNHTSSIWPGDFPIAHTH